MFLVEISSYTIGSDERDSSEIHANFNILGYFYWNMQQFKYDDLEKKV